LLRLSPSPHPLFLAEAQSRRGDEKREKGASCQPRKSLITPDFVPCYLLAFVLRVRTVILPEISKPAGITMTSPQQRNESDADRIARLEAEVSRLDKKLQDLSIRVIGGPSASFIQDINIILDGRLPDGRKFWFLPKANRWVRLALALILFVGFFLIVLFLLVGLTIRR
jgi:hypothetical protein